MDIVENILEHILDTCVKLSITNGTTANFKILHHEVEIFERILFTTEDVPKIRVANFAVDPVYHNSHNYGDEATSSTSHKAKYSSTCKSTASSPSEDIHINFVDMDVDETKFNETIDLKTDILDSLPNDTFDEENLSNSFPSYEPTVIDICEQEDEDRPSTSQKPDKSLNNQNIACFRYFKHEKFSTYHIQYLRGNNGKVSEPYIILNSVSNHNGNSLKGKLFLPKENFEILGRNIGEEEWLNVKMELRRGNPLSLRFKQKTILASLPTDYTSLKHCLSFKLNFFFQVEKSFALPAAISKSYSQTRTRFCQVYQRNDEMHDLSSMNMLGFQWINHIISSAEIVHQTRNMIRYKCFTVSEVEEIEIEVRKKEMPSYINQCFKSSVNLILSEHNANLIDKLFCQYSKAIYDILDRMLDSNRICHNSDANTICKSSMLEENKSKNAENLEDFCDEKVGEDEVFEIVLDKNVAREDDNMRKANYVDKLECSWSFIQDFQKCSKVFSICSFNDAEALSEHMNDHLSLNRTTYNSLTAFRHQIEIVDTLTLEFDVDEVKCPISYCRKKILQGVGRVQHFSLEHRVEVLCFLLVSQSNEKCSKLLDAIRNVLPKHIEELVKSYKIKIRRMENNKAYLGQSVGKHLEARANEVTSSAQDESKTNYSSESTQSLHRNDTYQCLWSSWRGLQQNCLQRFSIYSINDVVNLSKHINEHMSPPFKYKAFVYQCSVLESLSEEKDDLKCPISYCKKKVVLSNQSKKRKRSKVRHHDFKHQVEALCFLLINQHDDESVKLLSEIMNVLPKEMENLVNRYKSKNANAEKEKNIEIMKQVDEEISVETKIKKKGLQSKNMSVKATTLLRENAFKCITCFQNKNENLDLLSNDIKNHICHSEILSHGIKCLSCNEIYTIRKGSNDEHYLHVHCLFRNHIFNVMQKKKWNNKFTINQLLKPITYYCEVCQIQYKDHYSHISSQIHNFNTKLLSAFLDYCYLRKLFVLTGNNFNVKKEEIVFFFKTLHCFIPATMETRKKLCQILKQYISNVMDESRGPNSRGSKFKDWLDDPVAEAKLRQSSMPSTALGVCFSCNKIFTTSKSIEKHSMSQMHYSLSMNTNCASFICLKCDQFMSLVSYLKKRHIENCIEKDLNQVDRSKTNVSQNSTDSDLKNVKKIENGNLDKKDEYSEIIVSVSEDENDREVDEILKLNNSIPSTITESHATDSDSEINSEAFDAGGRDMFVRAEIVNNFDDILSKSNSFTSENQKAQKFTHQKRLNSEIFSESSGEKERLDSGTSDNISILETELFDNFDDVLSFSSKESTKRKFNEEVLNFEAEKYERRTKHNAQSNLNDTSEYFYFCLDCEKHTTEKNCKHLKHSRVPIGMDITKHLEKTGHENFEPIRNYVLPIKQNKMLRVKNISYNRKWGDRVRKCYKKLVLSGN